MFILKLRQKYSADTVSEDSSSSWEFFTNHYTNQTQAIRDSKFTWKTTNGSYHVGPDPPPGSEPLGIYYPRGAMLGGSSNNNAMGFVLPPDSDVCDFFSSGWPLIPLDNSMSILEKTNLLLVGSYCQLDGRLILEREQYAQIFRTSGELSISPQRHIGTWLQWIHSGPYQS